MARECSALYIKGASLSRYYVCDLEGWGACRYLLTDGRLVSIDHCIDTIYYPSFEAAEAAVDNYYNCNNPGEGAI